MLQAVAMSRVITSAFQTIKEEEAIYYLPFVHFLDLEALRRSSMAFSFAYYRSTKPKAV